jgi:hypothetical protein
MRCRARQLAVVLGLAAGLLALAHPVAIAGSDLWGNVAPASPLGSAGLFDRYPLSHYQLDEHFTAVSASLTGGVDASGVGPMIAYFLASILWWLTTFFANALIELFAFAFSLDLVNGSSATGGAGALAPVSRAIHSIYSNVLGAPWMVLAVSVVGMWTMWRALVQRRYAETAGALGLSLIYVVLALFFVAQPGTTIGTASKWTNQMSEAFLAVSDHGDPSGGTEAKDAVADQLFETLVYRPWTVLQFGGLEHCVLAGPGDKDSDPESTPVRPLSESPEREAELARRLGGGTEITADGKICVNNANKYGSHFLHFGVGSDERNAEYDALDHGDSSKLPEADSERAGYRLGVADKPATDAMEEGGQYQRLLIAIVVFVGELGAFLLLGALSVGVILAQVFLLLLLAFSPVALLAAAIPGRGHDFFRGWLQKLAGYLLRKAAYSLVLAVLLAVNGAIASATSAMGWLMSFGLQALFFWFGFLQRRTLTDGLIGIATGPRAPGHGAVISAVELYAGARIAGRVSRPLRRGGGAALSGSGRGVASGFRAVSGRLRGGGGRVPLFGTRYTAPGSMGRPGADKGHSADLRSEASAAGSVASAAAADTARGTSAQAREPGRSADGGAGRRREPAAGDESELKSRQASQSRSQPAASSQRRRTTGFESPQGKERAKQGETRDEQARPSRATQTNPDPTVPERRPARQGGGEPDLKEELRRERENAQRAAAEPKTDPPSPEAQAADGGPDSAAPASPPPSGRRRRRKGGSR